MIVSAYRFRPRLAERTVVDALRALPRATDRPPSLELLIADEQTAAAPPRPVAALVYSPSVMLLEQLRHDVSPEEWARHVDLDAALSVGAVVGGVLTALASAEVPNDRLARVHVLVAPCCRGRGYGQLVLTTLVHRVLELGLLPYATVDERDDAVQQLAATAGFVELPLPA
jgi:GNAT superfamily N-acetyltransferase